MVDSTVFSICGSVGLLLRSEVALVAALICEVALARGLKSEAEIMTTTREEVDVGETDDDDWEESGTDVTNELKVSGWVGSNANDMNCSVAAEAKLDVDNAGVSVVKNWIESDVDAAEVSVVKNWVKSDDEVTGVSVVSGWVKSDVEATNDSDVVVAELDSDAVDETSDNDWEASDVDVAGVSYVKIWAEEDADEMVSTESKVRGWEGTELVVKASDVLRVGLWEVSSVVEIDDVSETKDGVTSDADADDVVKIEASETVVMMLDWVGWAPTVFMQVVWGT